MRGRSRTGWRASAYRCRRRRSPRSSAATTRAIEDHRLAARHAEPAVARHLAVELARAPAGIAQCRQPACRARAPRRARLQHVERRGQPPAAGDVDAALAAPIVAVEHEAAIGLDRVRRHGAARRAPRPARCRAGASARAGRGRAHALPMPMPSAPFVIVRAHRDHRAFEARIADAGHGEQQLAGEEAGRVHRLS